MVEPIKQFRDYEELTALLRSRGMIVNDSTTIPVLMREGYYMVVNGYKDLFIDREATASAGDDRYQAGVSFENVHALFRFDAELRAILLQGIIRAEAALKSLCAHEFTRAHPHAANAYLSPVNYDPDHMQGARFVIGRVFMPLLETGDDPQGHGGHEGKEYIRHYMEDYGGEVPLWVLVNDVSLGPMARFYQSLTGDVRLAVAEGFTRLHAGDGSRPSQYVTPRRLDVMFKRLVFFRNLCAHDERCYNAHRNGRVNESVAAVFRDLQYLLDSTDYVQIQSRLDGLIGQLRRNLPAYADEVLRQMGYAQAR